MIGDPMHPQLIPNDTTSPFFCTICHKEPDDLDQSIASSISLTTLPIYAAIFPPTLGRPTNSKKAARQVLHKVAHGHPDIEPSRAEQLCYWLTINEPNLLLAPLFQQLTAIATRSASVHAKTFWHDLHNFITTWTLPPYRRFHPPASLCSNP
jgi:hypothetical protein